MNKEHKQLIEDCKGKLNKHNCRKETPIFRLGTWRFIDLECWPHNPKRHKPIAVEGEVGSSKLQRESNLKDLLEWKKQTGGEIFQIEHIDELDVRRLIKKYPVHIWRF